jgi:peptidase M50-like protein/tetratricopeptide repeat protein
LQCPGCCVRQAETAFNLTLAVSIIMAVVGFVLTRYEPAIPGARPLLYFGTLFLTIVFSVVPHELGHAMATLAVGMRLFKVKIGEYGAVLFARQVFGYDFVCHRIPFGGSVSCTPRQLRFSRLRCWFVSLSGPLANVLLIVVAQWAFVRFSHDDSLSYLLAPIIHGNVFLLAICLIPMRVWSEGNRVPNDGLALLTIPFTSSETLKTWHSTTFYYEMMEALERDRPEDAEHWLQKGTEIYPDNWWFQFGRAMILAHRQDHREARSAYLTALESPEASSEIQPYLWNNIAWEDLMIGDSALLEEADQLSEQALTELPWIPAVKGTRGSVLVELGRSDEGVSLLQQAHRENASPSNRALNACYLATAMATQGDLPSAREFVTEAERLDPACPLLERAGSLCSPAGSASYSPARRS